MIGNLSLEQLRVLVAIADAGSFSSAGRELGRVQSAISQSVATLEATQGVTLFDRSGHKPRLTEVGRVLVDQARMVLASAARFEAVAAGTRQGLEPELALAIDPLVPTAPLIDSLRALSDTFPALPVSFSTEGLGGSLRRLRSGSAALAICLLLPDVPEDIAAYPLLRVGMLPVVAPGHPLASLGRRATRGDVEPHVQLVLSDPVDPGGATTGLQAHGCGVLSISVDAWTSCSPALAGAACPNISSQRRSLQESWSRLRWTMIRHPTKGSSSTRHTSGITRWVQPDAGFSTECENAWPSPERSRGDIPQGEPCGRSVEWVPSDN